MRAWWCHLLVWVWGGFMRRSQGGQNRFLWDWKQGRHSFIVSSSPSFGSHCLAHHSWLFCFVRPLLTSTYYLKHIIFSLISTWLISSPGKFPNCGLDFVSSAIFSWSKLNGAYNYHGVGVVGGVWCEGDRCASTFVLVHILYKFLFDLFLDLINVKFRNLVQCLQIIKWKQLVIFLLFSDLF